MELIVSLRLISDLEEVHTQEMVTPTKINTPSDHIRGMTYNSNGESILFEYTLKKALPYQLLYRSSHPN